MIKIIDITSEDLFNGFELFCILKMMQENGKLDDFLKNLEKDAEEGVCFAKEILELESFQSMIEYLIESEDEATVSSTCKCTSSRECDCEKEVDDCEESCDYYDKLTKALDVIRKCTGCRVIMGNDLLISIFLEEEVNFKVKAVNKALNTIGFYATEWRIVEVANQYCFQFELEEL